VFYQDSLLEGSAGAETQMSNWKLRLLQDTPSLMSPTKALTPFIQKNSILAEDKKTERTLNNSDCFKYIYTFFLFSGDGVAAVKLYLRAIGKRMHKYVNCAKVILYKLSHFLFLQRKLRKVKQ
jgi:hypothetical protein